MKRSTGRPKVGGGPPPPSEDSEGVSESETPPNLRSEPARASEAPSEIRPKDSDAEVPNEGPKPRTSDRKSSRNAEARLDPKLARIARAGGTWRDVQTAFPGLSDATAQKRLSDARQRLGLNSRGRLQVLSGEEGTA